jgi:uncharacterized membrane protein
MKRIAGTDDLQYEMSKASFNTIAILSVLIALATVRFFIWPVDLVQPSMKPHVDFRSGAFFLHISFASVALLLLPMQLSRKLRMRHLSMHRWLGRVSAVSILIAGLSGLIISITTPAGPFAATGFSILSVLWVWVTAQAVIHAVKGRIADHRRWMTRSAALTFAAVTLRLQLPFLAFTVGMEVGYPFVAWTCWVPNVLFVEWLIRRKRRV